MGDSSVVAEVTLEMRRGPQGEPVWIADGKYEAATAEAALARVGAELDRGVAGIPGYGWAER
jgi:hypothetical protein